MRLTLVLLLLTGCWLPCPAGHTCDSGRPRCAYTEGADACSMIPKRYTCECVGRVVPVAATFDQPVCGHVTSWCDGRVTSYREVRSFRDLVAP